MRKNSKAKKRNRNKKMGGGSMLASTKREQYGGGSLAKIAKLGSGIADVIKDVLHKSNEEIGKEIPEHINNIFKESERLRAEGLKGSKLHEQTLENLYGENWRVDSPYIPKHVGQILTEEAQRRGGGTTIGDDESLLRRATDEVRQIYRAATTEGTYGQKVREEGFGSGLPVDRETRKAKGSYFGKGVAAGGLAVAALNNLLRNSGIDPEEATPEQIEAAHAEVMGTATESQAEVMGAATEPQAEVTEASDKKTSQPMSYGNLFSKAFTAGASEFIYPNPKTGVEEIHSIQFEEQEIVPQTDSQGRKLRYVPSIDRVLPVDSESNLTIFELYDSMPENDSKSFRDPPPPTAEQRVQKQEGGAMAMPPEMMADPMNEVPVDTYANATPEEIEAAQVPDEEMEGDYLVFILNEALVPEEQQYLMQALEGDPQLSQIFDKVVETASEFSGSGEVTGPGDGISDSIPARLSDGEFVITQKATEQIGADNLQTMMDDAERAYDGGMMRKNRYLGGVMSRNEDNLELEDSTGDDIRKLMSIKANKTPSLR